VKQSVILSSALAAATLVPAGVSAAPSDAPTSGPTSSSFRTTHRCGTPQIRGVATEASVPSFLAAGAQRTIYLNRNGGTYQFTNAATNSATNVSNSNIIGHSGTATIAPLGTGFNWPMIVACVTEDYKKYNIRVTETEPTSGDYVEAVVGGDGTELGFGPNQLFGIASADNFCGLTERGIAFSFSETHRQVPDQDEELCATISHEVGHLLGLEHETLAPDVMSYVLVSETTSKSFVDQASQCGTTPQQPMACSCGGSSTNSAARLTNFLGLRSTETVPPTLAVQDPTDRLVLPPSFIVTSTATDNEAMSDVTVLIDGIAVGSDAEPEGDTYKITVSGIAEGDHALEVVARDQAGNTASKQLAITVKKLGIGETCVDNAACEGNLCANSASGNFCTQVCEVSNDTCPDGFDCTAVGATAVCVASPDGGGCGCSSTANPGAMALLMFGVGAVLLRRRRRAGGRR